jgi:tetratricopeptide (TPR) repeat protein
MHNARWRQAAGLLALLGGMSGCASGPQAGTLDRVIADHEAGMHEQACDEAGRIADRSRGQAADQAAYLSGLCAYELGRLDESAGRLQDAARSDDPATAARAKATLGLVRRQQGRYLEAAGLLDQAALELTGPDAREAAAVASECRQNAGRSLSTRGAGGPDRLLARRASAGPSGVIPRDDGRFTLQAGAFRERRRADGVAGEAADVARRHGLGPVRVVPSDNGRGEELYLVQIGRFETRQAAAASRAVIGRLEYIVAPVAQ